MALATLSIDLVARLAEMQAGLDRAGRLNEKTAAAIEARWDKAGKVAGAVFAGLGTALAAAGIVDRFRTVIDGLDQLNDAADATGASIENLSALEDIALSTGTSFETATAAVVKLNQVLSSANAGSQQAAIFEALGLSVEKLKKEDPAEALRQVAVALSTFSDDGDKARAVQELFGKSIREVAPLLKDLSEQGQLNATVTAEQAEQASVFNKQLAALNKNVTDAARSITSSLLPALNEFFASVKRLQANEGGFFGGVAETFNVDFLRGRIAASNEEIERLAPSAERARALLAIQPDSIRAKATLAEFSQLQKAADDYSKQLDEILYAGKGRRPANEGGGGLLKSGIGSVLAGAGAPSKGRVAKSGEFVGPLPGFETKAFDEKTGAVSILTEALKSIDNTDIAKLQRLNAVYDELVGLRASGFGGGPGLEEAIANIRDELAKLDPVQVAAAESRKRLNDLLAQTPAGKLDKVLIDVELLNRAFAAGQVDAEKWAAGVRVATAQLGSEARDQLDEMSEFAAQASRNIQDSLGATLEAVLGGHFDSIDKLWGNMIKRLVAQAAAAELSKSLFGADFAKTGKVGGLAGEAVDWFKQIPWGEVFGARANGGPVSAGMPYIVGERGPEIVVPRVAGMVLRNGVMPQAQGGGGTTISNQIIVQGDASENTLRLVQGALANFEARMMTRNR
jgi:hypothetical protein